MGVWLYTNDMKASRDRLVVMLLGVFSGINKKTLHTRIGIHTISPCSAHAQTITGKVVGVSDGDTINVLQDRTQYKIRLYGIDCPESGQDFGNRAKKFVSDMVYGKQVQVIQKDSDGFSHQENTMVLIFSVQK